MPRTDVPHHDEGYVLEMDDEDRPTGRVICCFCGQAAFAIEDVQHSVSCRLHRSRWDGLDYWESEHVRDLVAEHAVRDEPDLER